MDEYTWADDRSIEERRMDEIVSKADIEELRDDILRCEGAVFVKLATLFFYLFGSSLAMVISYDQNHSILWGIGHGLLTWWYVLYFAIFK